MSRQPERAPLDRYLDRICRRLWFASARERRETREELRQHLERLAAHAARIAPIAEAMEDAMRKFGDPKEIGGELSRQHLRRRRWLSALIKTVKVSALAALVLCLSLTGYWYFGLSRPMEQEPALAPVPSAAATLAAIQAAHDGYARQIQSVRFQGINTVRSYNGSKYEGEFTHTYEAASKGLLCYSREVADERYGIKPDETRHSDDIWIFDGRTMRAVRTDWNGPVGSARAKETYGVSASLPGGGFKPHDPDEVLQYGYKVHGVWIGDMLRRGKPRVEGTVANAQFGPLTLVRCRNRSKWGADEAVRLWLSPKLGWLAVKTEAVEANEPPPFALRTVYEARNVTRAGAFWVASGGRFRYDMLRLGRRQETTNHTQRFVDITFNDVPDSLFVPHYPVGTRFWTLATDAHPLLPTTLEAYQAAPPVAEQSVSSLWLYELFGCIVLGGAGFAVLKARRRGRRLTA